MFISGDPGLSNFGLAVIKDTNPLTVVETLLVKNTRKFTPEEKDLEQRYGTRSVKVLHILNNLQSLFDKYPSVNELALEAPFYHYVTPQAYGSLLEVIFAIKYKMIIDTERVLTMIEPLLAKKIFTEQGTASKDRMKERLIELVSNGKIVIPTSVEDLSEHEIDAIAIGYSYCHLKQQSK